MFFLAPLLRVKTNDLWLPFPQGQGIHNGLTHELVAMNLHLFNQRWPSGCEHQAHRGVVWQ